ncbi:hypothetical protein V1517DRAFT_171050 [Lipomyces orientalis]|uniref:Uncharacterized protein n=1 Tax=Lipomyces orientalis TaxID=1233043 RepID=A0ACC3TLA4_9ASCO
MNLRTLVTFAAIITGVLTAPKDVHLIAKSDNKTIDGVGLCSIRESLTVSYMFLGTGIERFTWETTNNTFFDTTVSDMYVAYLQRWGNLIVVAAGYTDSQFTVSPCNYLVVNGSERVFYAAKSTNDPANYSSSYYQVLYYAEEEDAPDDSIPFSVYVESADTTSSSIQTATLYSTDSSS